METSQALTQYVKSEALNLGADLVGVAPIERFESAPEETNPAHYMPEATRLISVGLQISDGVCDAWGNYDEPGKSAGPYLFFGYGQLNMELGRIVHSLAKKLERKKYKTLIFPPTWTVSCYKFMDRDAEDGSFQGDFSHRHAAVAAGLGEIGWHGLTMTPEFGTRVRFCSVITDAPLDPDEMYSGPALCQPRECRLACVKACPTNAFTKGYNKCEFGETAYKQSKIDKIRCFYAVLGFVQGSGGRSKVEIPDGPGNWEHFSRAWADVDPIDKRMFSQSPGLILGDYCGRCLLECPAPFQQH